MSKGPGSLKDQNRLALLAVLGMNLLVLIAIVKTGQLIASADVSTLAGRAIQF